MRAQLRGLESQNDLLTRYACLSEVVGDRRVRCVFLDPDLIVLDPQKQGSAAHALALHPAGAHQRVPSTRVVEQASDLQTMGQGRPCEALSFSKQSLDRFA